MKYLNVKILGAVLSCVILIGVSVLFFQDFKKDDHYRSLIKKIAARSEISAQPDFHGKLDKLRVFINTNSQHLEDEEFFARWESQTLLAEAFLDYLEGRRADLPHMECSTRRGLMSAILKQEFGYRTRSADLYLPNPNGTFSSHAALDVFNPETNRWETYDPEYDVYWARSDTGERITMLDAALDITNTQACNAQSCGWDIKTRENAEARALKDHLALIVIIDKDKDQRLTYYRPDINAENLYDHDGKKGTYCQVISKNCRDGFFALSEDTIKMTQAP